MSVTGKLFKRFIMFHILFYVNITDVNKVEYTISFINEADITLISMCNQMVTSEIRE